jgi:hypothetical protein
MFYNNKENLIDFREYTVTIIILVILAFLLQVLFILYSINQNIKENKILHISTYLHND